MKVVSPLANLDVFVGDVRAHDGVLVIDSDPESSMPCEVTVSTDDARRFLGALFRDRRALWWVVCAPFRMLGPRRSHASGDSSAQTGRAVLNDPINRPW